MTDTEVVYDDGANTYMVTGQAAQDLRDGAALRRLREACPVGERWFEVFGPHPESGHFQVVVETVGQYDTPGVLANGATIAEAADACREALSGPPSGTRPEDGTAR